MLRMACAFPSKVDPPVACTVMLLVASSPFAPLTQKVCPATLAEEVHCGKVSVLADDVALFHTIVPSAVVAVSVTPLATVRVMPSWDVAPSRPFEIVRVLPSGLTMPKAPVVASPGVTASDQWSAPSELAQTE